MKIVIFGASGGTGLEIVKQALETGHQVTAFVRNPAKVGLQRPNLTIFQGDVLEAAATEKAIEGQEAVISALGPTRPIQPGSLETAARQIVAAMKKSGLNRLIATTGAGIRTREDQPKLADFLMQGLLTWVAGDVLRESTPYVKIIQTSELDWTIVRFPRLTDGPWTGQYRVGWVGKNSGLQLSRADGADFVLKELARAEYVRKSPVISY